ncbi:MAG: flagellar basal body-associated FliL family protein [Bdellovibrionales bacterium]
MLTYIKMNNYICKHKMLFAAIYVLAPMLLAWVGYMYSEVDRSRAYRERMSLYNPSTNTVLYHLPRVSLSMSMSGTARSGTMKLDLGLEVSKGEVQRVIDFEPRIVEKIIMYMHKQNLAELQQPWGEREFRERLTREISTGADPVKVASIVVNRMVFQ